MFHYGFCLRPRDQPTSSRAAVPRRRWLSRTGPIADSRNRDTFGESIRMMRERKLTFEEAVSSGGFGLMDRYRLERVRRELFEQLQQTPFA